MKKIWLGLLCFVLYGTVAAQIYSYTNATNGSPASVAANATGGSLTRVNGANTPGSPCGTGFNTTNHPTTTTYSSTLTAVEVTVTADAGYQLDVTSFSVGLRRTGTGPTLARLAYSTDGGTTWTDKGSNDAPCNCACGTTTTATWTTSFSVTNPTSLLFRVYLFGSGATTGNSQILNLTINGTVNATCVMASQPTTIASASAASDLGCNAGKISWTNGNGSGRLVVMKAGSATTAPTDGTTYSANTLFGSGSSISGGFVVFNGTSNNVFVTGLSASTTYFWNVYEYNGSGSCINYTPTGSSGSFTTTSCSIPVGITAIYIDACPATCTYEGNNEIIFGQSGSYGLKVNTNGPVVQYNSTSPPTTTFISTYATNSTNVSTLNTATSPCGSTVFVDPNVQGYIPPNSKFMIANNCMCSPSAYDFSGLCNQTVYVVFGTNAAWPCNSAGGIFGNAAGCTPPTDLRYIEADFNNWGVSTLPIYSYDICQLTGTGNGDYALFDPAGGAAVSYGNSSCTVPLIVLPVEIVSFTSEKVNRSSELKWSTASEKDLSKILVQRSMDGFNYQTLSQLLPSNSENGSQYFFTDYQPLNGKNYYRLKFIDNGDRTFTSPIQMQDFASADDVYFSEGVLYLNAGKEDKSMRFSLYDISGREIVSASLQGETSSFDLRNINCTAGVYIVKVFSENGVRSVKKIVVR